MKIYGIIGQSNAVGQAPMEEEATDPNVMLYGFDQQWRLASEPSHNPVGAVDVNYVGQKAGFSCLLTFAKERLARGDEKVGLVPSARNGTALKEWLPNISRTSYYGVFVGRMLEAAESGDIAGVLVHQGETDAIPSDPRADPVNWVKNFTIIVNNLRLDLKKPFLPVVFAQLGVTTNPLATNWQLMRTNQATIYNGNLIPGVKMFKTHVFPIFDGIHLSAEGQRMLGVRFAENF